MFFEYFDLLNFVTFFLQDLGNQQKHIHRLFRRQSLFLSLGTDSEEANEIARSLFEEGIDKGNCECMFEYGKLLLKGKGCQSDKSEAAKYFKMAA